MANIFDRQGETAWCPGCGNFGLRKIMLDAIAELGLKQPETVFVSGIGQAAKAPQYYNGNFFNGLHGRSLPAAAGIKAANPGLNVIVESGDGDMYGEGGNHFIHAIRRNPDITVIVHNNMVYGLTKGQASPTSQEGMVTPIQVDGVFEEPLNPIALAITMDAPFVARGSAGEPEKTKELIKQAIAHRGFSLVDVFQACVSFNKINTHKWFKEHTYFLPADHDPRDRLSALKRAMEADPMALGLFYINDNRKIFEDKLAPYEKSREPLYSRQRGPEIVNEILAGKK
ncbi:MAG: thiamine pyrophosphate-dependent enzyme [Candidatus Goldiibacteriota bacterium]|jgi:2-oxoglutarate ferredoxin oxidoreductase subunit beta